MRNGRIRAASVSATSGAGRRFGQCAALAAAIAVLAGAPAWASDGPATLFVTSAADDGPGSFRAAVEAANTDPRVRHIRFRNRLIVVLASDVVYTGRQPLRIDGKGSTLAGDPAAPPSETWDGGLFAATGGADLAIRNLAFRDSFDNGLGVFVPAGAKGSVRVNLHGVTIEDARFHGLFFDGQASSGFNTDDVPHPDCEDPHPFDSEASVVLTVRHSEIARNGTLAGGFDTGSPEIRDGEEVLTGCPADFDGIRVDEGGVGSIHASVTHTLVEGNLADGIEYDETEAGGVSAWVQATRVFGNGETGTDDLDDGFDVDEADAGDLRAFLLHSVFGENRDEGIDLDEAGEGDVLVTLVTVEASRNEDEGFKIDEEDDGDLVANVIQSEIDESLSQQGIDFTEAGAGDYDVRLVGTRVTGNDDEGLASLQETPGAGKLVLIGSDLTGNGDPSLDLIDIEFVSLGSLLD